MTYTEHYFRSIKFALWCSKMYFVCTIHAIFPFWFENTFSTEIESMALKLKEEKLELDKGDYNV